MEWLSTGKIIDKLKEGEVAVNGFRVKQEFIKRNEHGFYWCDREGQIRYGDSFVINEVVSSMMWRILPPKYISFEEAKEAYEEGKTIRCDYLSAVDKTLKCVETFTKSRMDLDGSLSWYMIINGEWSIKGE